MKKFGVLMLLSFLCNTVAFAQESQDFRNYDNAPEHVKKFYNEQHTYQTLAFGKKKLEQYRHLNHGTYSIWEVLELLNKMVDESDPDLDLPQIHHALQTAEAIRQDGHPDWLVLIGLIHDLGKMLTFWGEPQWAVVGDTFPLGCQFSDKIIYFDSFKNNPDLKNPLYNTPLGIYSNKGNPVGLKNVIMSWGHDEYLYHVIKDQSTLPEEAKFIVRFHSFYPLHKEGEYQYLLDEKDKKFIPWLQTFRKYDLYSKSSKPIVVSELKSYYQDLIRKYFPREKIRW